MYGHLETAENGAKSNIVVSVHSKSENAGKLVHEGRFSAPMRDSKPLTKADEQADRNDRTKAENRACRQRATSQPDVNVANKGTSKLLTAECIQNWSETIVKTMAGKTSVRKPSLWIPNKFWETRFTWS